MLTRRTLFATIAALPVFARFGRAKAERFTIHLPPATDPDRAFRRFVETHRLWEVNGSCFVRNKATGEKVPNVFFADIFSGALHLTPSQADVDVSFYPPFSWELVRGSTGNEVVASWTRPDVLFPNERVKIGGAS